MTHVHFRPALQRIRLEHPSVPCLRICRFSLRPHISLLPSTRPTDQAHHGPPPTRQLSLILFDPRSPADPHKGHLFAQLCSRRRPRQHHVCVVRLGHVYPPIDGDVRRSMLYSSPPLPLERSTRAADRESASSSEESEDSRRRGTTGIPSFSGINTTAKTVLFRTGCGKEGGV